MSISVWITMAKDLAVAIQGNSTLLARLNDDA